MHPILLHLLPALLIFPLAAQGTVVNTVTDEDNGSRGGGTGISLREAVKYSPAGETITFAPALSAQTIRLTLGELVIGYALTIDGSALPVRITLSADKTGDGKTSDDTRVIRIAAGTVILDSLVISGGNCPGSPNTQGAGIYVSSSQIELAIRNSDLSGNSASAHGGGIFCRGIVNIENCRFTGNSAQSGAAIYVDAWETSVLNTTVTGNSALGGGGGIYSKGTLHLQNSAIIGNTAASGGGILSDGQLATIENSVVSGNTASGSGGGICNVGSSLILRNSTCSGNYAAPNGGGIYHQSSGSLKIENSTLSGNTAKGGGGGVSGSSGNIGILNSTVCGNTATSFPGGGISVYGATLTVGNSIITGNTAIGEPAHPDIFGTFTGSNNITSGDPFLAPLGDYGGPTQTMPPLPGSPAINAGAATTLTTDQRGFLRDTKPDLGAVEYTPAHDLPLVQSFAWSTDVDGDGNPYGVEQALGTDPAVADSANLRNLTAPTFNASGHAVLSFGLAPAAAGTRWILRRSTDLLTFSEIYRYDGTADTAAPGITFLRNAFEITVTDTTAPSGRTFYRFEALLEP